MEGHGRRSLQGGAISLAARAINAVVQVGSILLLARLLSPEDYGLVSMVAAITGFAPLLVDLGTRDAVVQRPGLSKGEVSALFWITIAMGSGFALIVAASGPFISRFYGEPRLTAIALLSSTTFLTVALTCQHQALMRRAMMFRELAVIDIVANVFGAGIAIAMAFYGFKYWALVVRPIVTNLLVAIGVWSSCRWFPQRPDISAGVKEMLKFGANLTGFSFFDFLGRNGDRVAIGNRYGAIGLGYYQNALTVYDNLLDLTFPLHGVAVASFSKLRSNPEELRRLWAKAISTLSFFAMPAFGVLAVTSQDLIVLMLGSKWSIAGVLLSVLALRGIPHVVERTLGWLHVAAGKADRWMKYGAVATCIQLFALFCGLPFGPIGVVTAYMVCMYLLFVPAIAYAGRPLGIRAKNLMEAVGPQMVAALCSSGIGFLLRHWFLADCQPLVRVAWLAFAYLSCYAIIAVGFFRVRMPLRTVLSLVRDPLIRLFCRMGYVRGSSY